MAIGCRDDARIICASSFWEAIGAIIIQIRAESRLAALFIISPMPPVVTLRRLRTKARPSLPVVHLSAVVHLLRTICIWSSQVCHRFGSRHAALSWNGLCPYPLINGSEGK
jgi:hypothetical protein